MYFLRYGHRLQGHDSFGAAIVAVFVAVPVALLLHVTRVAVLHHSLETIKTVCVGNLDSVRRVLNKVLVDNSVKSSKGEDMRNKMAFFVEILGQGHSAVQNDASAICTFAKSIKS
jgi:hypothetical protein